MTRTAYCVESGRQSGPGGPSPRFVRRMSLNIGTPDSGICAVRARQIVLLACRFPCCSKSPAHASQPSRCRSQRSRSTACKSLPVRKAIPRRCYATPSRMIRSLSTEVPPNSHSDQEPPYAGAKRGPSRTDLTAAGATRRARAGRDCLP